MDTPLSAEELQQWLPELPAGYSWRLRRRAGGSLELQLRRARFPWGTALVGGSRGRVSLRPENLQPERVNSFAELILYDLERSLS